MFTTTRKSKTRASAPLTLMLGTVAVAGMLLTTTASAQPVGFGITDETSYQRFKDAALTAEYVREMYLVGPGEFQNTACGTETESSPRTLAAMASAMAFLERNPGVSADELDAFLWAIDLELATMFPSDPGLTVPEHLLAAVRFSRVVTGPNAGDPDAIPGAGPYSAALVGFDTEVGERALELLGIELPEYFDFNTLRERTLAIESSATLNIGTTAESGLLLMQAFAAQTPDGVAVDPGIPDVFLQYLCVEGYDIPGVGAVLPAFPGINKAILALPDYQGYLNESAQDFVIVTGASSGDLASAQSNNPIHERLRQAVYGSLEVASDLIREFNPAPPSVDDGLLLSEAQLLLLEQQRIADIRRDSEQRAAMLFNAALLYDNTDAAPYVEDQLDLGSAAIGANKHWANVKAGLEIGAGIASTAAAINSGELGDVISGVTDTVFGIFGAAENNFSRGVTDDDIFEQVQEVQIQLQGVQTQLNGRFDAVDSKLDQIFSSMTQSFGLVFSDLNNIEDNIALARQQIQDLSVDLHRLENTVVSIAQDQQYSEFSGQLGPLTGRSIEDLPYALYQNAEFDYFEFANTDSKTFAFAGSGNPPFALDNADMFVGSGSLSSRLQDLISWASSATFGGPVFNPEEFAAIEPWAYGSTAYSELADQSPWYTAARLPSATALGSAITEGERLLSFSSAARSVRSHHGLTDDSGSPIQESNLLAGAAAHYEAAAANLQDAINAKAQSILGPTLVIDPGAVSGDNYLDLWSQRFDLDPLPLANEVTHMTTAWGNSSNNLHFTSAPTTINGYELFFADSDSGIGETQRERALLVRARALQIASESGSGAFPPVHWYMTNVSVDEKTWRFNIALSATAGQPSGGFIAKRNINFQVLNYNHVRDEWEPTRYGNPGIPALTMEIIWDDILRDALMTGQSIAGPTEYEFTNHVGTTSRIRFVSDSTEITGAYSSLRSEIRTWLHALRTDVRDAVMQDFQDEVTPIGSAALGLNNAEAMLDAYTTLVTPGVFRVSELTRSALRGGVPDALNGLSGSEVGLRSPHAFDLLQKFANADTSSSQWGEREFDFATIADEHLIERARLVRQDLALAIDLPAQTSPIAAWTLAELRSIRDHGAHLAIDDRYDDHRNGQARSVLDNDTRQLLRTVNGVDEFRPIEASAPIVFDQFGNPVPTDPVEAWPAHGTVVINPDGTFVYTPFDPEFEGTDYFEYMTLCDVSAEGASPVIILSPPAFVRVKIAPDSNACVADSDGDGDVDLTDFGTFGAAFGSTAGGLNYNADVDFDNDGDVDLTDFGTFGAEFGSAGCFE